MLIPFVKEDLSKEPFVKSEMLFSLFHRIISGETEVALKTSDGNLIALCSPGRDMWLWINEELSLNMKSKLLVRLAGELLNKNITGVVAEQDISGGFAACYAEIRNIEYKKNHGLIGYACTEVKEPKGVKGEMSLAELNQTDIVAKCLAGFSKDALSMEVDIEKCMPAAREMIEAGNLYVWSVGDEVVSIAKIGQRLPGLARINSVYTLPDKRKNGYASALVAGVSMIALKEGLKPVLYADMTYPDSNGVYIGIGYTEQGRLDSYSFVYEK